jgi:hypothetical protein
VRRPEPLVGRFAPPGLQEGPQWVGLAVRFAGDERSPNGRWLTFEFDAAQVEVTQRDPYGEGIHYERPGMPTRVYALPSRMDVTVSGYPAAKSTWPNWFPGIARREDPAGAVAAAPARSPVRDATRRAPHIIGGDLARGGERPRNGGWL